MANYRVKHVTGRVEDRNAGVKQASYSQWHSIVATSYTGDIPLGLDAPHRLSPSP